MNIEQAAVKAFRRCTGSSNKVRGVAKYLTVLFLKESGVNVSPEERKEIDSLLEQWFDVRKQHGPKFRPVLTEQPAETPSDVPSDGLPQIES